jgi:LCP family protein required for cell wall assembly
VPGTGRETPVTASHVDERVATPAPRRRRKHRGYRRGRTLRGALLVTCLAAIVPGSGYVWAGRRLGYLLMAATVAGEMYLLARVSDVDTIVHLAVDPARLRLFEVAVVLGFVLWAFVLVTTYLMVRPRAMPHRRAVGGTVFVAALCLLVGLPAAQAVRYAATQADLVASVFTGNETATTPTDVSEEDPWGGRKHVSVLILGGDSGPNRYGLRTDTVALLDTDTRTGESVLFSLPRNMMNAQFPEDSPLHDVYPDGFRGEGDPASWMLNAVYGMVPALHPGILGTSQNEGADAVKQAVAGSLGVPVDYYVLVDLQGFPRIVDAMGGVTVNVNEPVAIGGDTDRGIPPESYLQPGPDQHLDGFHALWYSRGRYGSDDYQRMLRQRCMINALVEEARPLNLLRRYEDLAEAGKEILRTDIPQKLLPAFVDLAAKVKEHEIRSVAFVASDRFYSGDPDFAWMQSVVDRALEPPSETQPARQPGGDGSSSAPVGDPSSPTTDPGTAVDIASTCGYHPVGES